MHSLDCDCVFNIQLKNVDFAGNDKRQTKP